LPRPRARHQIADGAAVAQDARDVGAQPLPRVGGTLLALPDDVLAEWANLLCLQLPEDAPDAVARCRKLEHPLHRCRPRRDQDRLAALLFDPGGQAMGEDGHTVDAIILPPRLPLAAAACCSLLAPSSTDEV